MLRITDIQNNSVNWNSVPFVQIDEDKAEDYLLYSGNILFARTGATVGKSFLIESLNEKYVFASYLIRIQSSQNIYVKYVRHFLESGFYWEQITEKSVGTGQPNVNGTILGELVIPLPPFAEQQRIVAEIEQLFALIDTIEESRLSLEQLVKQAKSKVLDLAIRGKLVPQNPDDEPASALLERIRKAQKGKQTTADTFHYQNEPPFEVPKGWVWVKIKDIFEINPKNNLDDDEDVSFIPMALISDGYSNEHKSEIRKWKDVKKGFTHFQEGDVGLAKITPCFENRKSVLFCDLENKYGAGTTELHILRPIYESFLSRYALWFVKTEEFINNGISNFTGAVGQQRVGKNIIEDTYFPLPPLAEQQRIVLQIEKIFALFDEIIKAVEA